MDQTTHQCCQAPIDGPHKPFCAHAAKPPALRKGLDLYAASPDQADKVGLMEFRLARNKLLLTFDPARLRAAGFVDMSDEMLRAVWHLARVHCEDIPVEERRISEAWLDDPKKREWLAERGMGWDKKQILQRF